MSKINSTLTHRNAHYIDGAFESTPDQATQVLVSPFTEQVFGSVALGGVAEVDRAVRAARTAFPKWSNLSRGERAQWLGKLARALESRIEAIAEVETTNMGCPIAFSRMAQAKVPIMVVASHVEMLARGPHDELIGNSRVVREPIGVVGAIAAWNYPLLLLLGKVAPALTAGCTVVAKPSELTPLTAMLVADALAEVAFPSGVVNIVNGTGPEVGQALVTHSDVDMISFTGSTATGRSIMSQAAATVKKVGLELGGKSASIVLDDAPLEKAVRASVQGCFVNAGQTCIALTRLIVPEHLHAEAIEIAAHEAGKFVLGDPMDAGTSMGPLAFGLHRDRVRKYINVGIAEGARVVVGGAAAPAGLASGFFVQPTVFADVKPHMRIAQEEIFGPVLSILSAKDEVDAIAIANGTIYGLNGAVWSADAARAVHVGRQLRCGKVDINGGGWNLNAPAGGFKQSGIGRERGPYAVEEFLEVKSLQFNDEELAKASSPR